MTILCHSDIESLLGAYAIDAIDPAEAQAVSLHLTTCPRCRGEVVTHRETAELLDTLRRAVPQGVWEAIAANIERAITSEPARGGC